MARKPTRVQLAVQAERERCAVIIEKVARQFSRSLPEGERLYNLARLIRGTEHADWCQSKYKEPCTCGLDQVRT